VELETVSGVGQRALRRDGAKDDGGDIGGAIREVAA